MVKCNKCNTELAYTDALRCPVCGREWNEILTSDENFFNGDLEEQLNALISYAYRKLRLFIADKQIYGAMLQIKDLYEILMKFPVLVASAYFFHEAKENEDSNKFLVNLVNRKNSMGDWLDHVGVCTRLIYKKTSLSALSQILQKTSAFCNKHKVVAWRNKHIGHSATPEMGDSDMYEDLFDRIGNLTAFLCEVAPLYSDIKIYVSDGKNQTVLNGYQHAIFSGRGELRAAIGETDIALEPFFYLENEGLYFYDNYFSKKSYLDIVEYPRGKRDIRPTHIFDDYCQNHVYRSEANDAAISKADIDIATNVLNVSDFVEPKFVYQWICDRMDNGDKIFTLQFQKGMGKSTLSRALDPFSMNKTELPFTSVRVYYINPTYGSKVYQFASEVHDLLSRDDDNVDYHGRFKYLQEETLTPKEDFAEVLNNARRQPYFNACNRLLFIIDGLDELNPQKGLNITDFIPDPEMLDDDVFIMITSRTLAEEDAVIYSTRAILQSYAKYPSLLVLNDNEEYKLLKRKYFDEHIIRQLKELCKRKKVVFDDSGKDDIFHNIENETFLYLRQLKELTQIKAVNRIDQGAKQLTCLDVFKRQHESLLDEYFTSLKSNYGDKYFKQFSKIMVTLAIVDDYLTIEDLSYLVVNGSTSMSFIGFINTIRMFLTVKRTNNGNSYKISHLENLEYIRKNMPDEIHATALEMLGKIDFIIEDGKVDYDDPFDMTFMPYFLNIVRTFRNLGDEQNYRRTLDIARRLIMGQKTFLVGDNLNETLLERNVLYQQALLTYGQKHLLGGSKEEQLAFCRSLVMSAKFHAAMRNTDLIIDNYDKAYKILSKLPLTDDEKFEFYFEGEPLCIYFLAERQTYEDILRLADYLDGIMADMQSRNFPFTPLSLSYYVRVRGAYYNYTKQYEKALPYTLKALEYLRNPKTIEDFWHLADMLSDTGKNYTFIEGKTDEALIYLNEALETYKKCLAEGFFLYGKNIWFVHRRISECYKMRCEYDKAIEYIMKGVDYLEEREKLNLLANKSFIPLAFYELAKIYVDKGDNAQALVQLKTAQMKLDNLEQHQQNKLNTLNLRKNITGLFKKLTEKGA